MIFIEVAVIVLIVLNFLFCAVITFLLNKIFSFERITKELINLVSKNTAANIMNSRLGANPITSDDTELRTPTHKTSSEEKNPLVG